MSRRNSFLATLGAGVLLVAVGLFLSAPIGPTDGPLYSNPRMPFAPTVFVIGFILIFGSAVVYELAGATESVTAEASERAATGDAAVALLDLDPEDEASPQLAP